MKTINSSSTRRSRAYVYHAQQNVTNASFRWQPDAGNSEKAVGRVFVTLIGKDDRHQITAMLTSFGNGLQAIFIHHSPSSAPVSERTAVSMNESIHMELDVDPKTSNVVFWINDKGMDMGIIPGFEGGASAARWMATGDRHAHKLTGKLTDCAVATTDGWRATRFRDEHVNRQDLHEDHIFDVSSPNSIAIGGLRSIV